MDAIKVSVVEFGDRKCFQMQYRDPITGRKKTKSTRVERTGRKKERTEAERVAAKFEAELREGRYHEASKILWSDFRERYENEVLSGLAENTDGKVSGVFNQVERILKPKYLRSVDASRLSFFASKLREEGRAEATVEGILGYVRAILRWAVSVGMLPVAPKIPKVKRAKRGAGAKGRPIAREEFERMLDKAASVVGEAAAPSWRFLLEGLWCTGLRLGEALNTYWDRTDRISVDLLGEFPALWIPGEMEKGNQDRLLALAPEAADLLLAVDPADRTGAVFQPRSKRTEARLSEMLWVSKTITEIGKAANVVVAKHPTTGKPKYASAHDLRRSFGSRWAEIVMPVTLKEMMRHSDIATTMKYYVRQTARSTAAIMRDARKKAAAGNKTGNSPQNQHVDGRQGVDASSGYTAT